MSDSRFFVLTDGTRNVPIAGWAVEGGWWAIAVDGCSGVSVGWPYRMFSSSVWREGETKIPQCRTIAKWKTRYRRPVRQPDDWSPSGNVVRMRWIMSA
jgi:hypothetical protein